MGRRTSDGRALIVGQIVGQTAMLAVVPVYSRLVPVVDVGLFQIATAIALIVQPLATMRLEIITPATASLARARQRAALALVLSGATSLAGVLLGVLLASTDSQGAELAIGAGLLLFAYAWTAIDNAVLIRVGRLRALAWRNALAGVIAALLQLGASVWLPTSLALAAAFLVGRAVAIVATRWGKPEVSEDPNSAEVEDDYGLRRALPAAMAGVVTAGALQALMLTTAALFGAVGAAQLGMAQRIAGTPTSLVGQGLSQIVASRASKIIRERSAVLFQFVRWATLRLLAAAAVLAVALATLGPLLAVPVLGPAWATAGILIAILAPPLAMFLVLVPTMPVMVMARREKLLLGLNVFRLIAIITTTALVGTLTRDLIFTAAITSIVWTGAYGVSLLALVRVARGWDDTVSRQG